MTIDYGLFDRVEMAIPLFYPRPDRTPAPPGATDHAIEVAPGVSVAARHYAAAGARGTLLYFHGNGEVVGDHDGIAPLYRAVGLDLFVVDYRGYGGSGGRPSVAALVADAHPVAERFHALLDARGASRARFLMGRSLGSHPAVELAARRALARGGPTKLRAAGRQQDGRRRLVTGGRKALAWLSIHPHRDGRPEAVVDVHAGEGRIPSDDRGDEGDRSHRQQTRSPRPPAR